jgi:hypothetical protein
MSLIMPCNLCFDLKFYLSYLIIDCQFGRGRERFLEKYDSAAIRHFLDAKALRSIGQLDNAGHLIGFAVECAVKHRISTLSAGADGPHGHFPAFLAIARKHLQQRSGYTTSMFALLKSGILENWDVSRRYYETGNTTQTEIDSWFADANRIFASASLKVHQ